MSPPAAAGGNAKPDSCPGQDPGRGTRGHLQRILDKQAPSGVGSPLLSQVPSSGSASRDQEQNSSSPSTSTPRLMLRAAGTFPLYQYLGSWDPRFTLCGRKEDSGKEWEGAR